MALNCQKVHRCVKGPGARKAYRIVVNTQSSAQWSIMLDVAPQGSTLLLIYAWVEGGQYYIMTKKEIRGTRMCAPKAPAYHDSGLTSALHGPWTDNGSDFGLPHYPSSIIVTIARAVYCSQHIHTLKNMIDSSWLFRNLALATSEHPSKLPGL